jgi:hypothetical protein
VVWLGLGPAWVGGGGRICIQMSNHARDDPERLIDAKVRVGGASEN